MLTLQTTVTDRATPVVLAVSAAVRPEQLRPVVGRATVNVFRRHLFAADRARPNVLGGARTHFYAAAARGTSFTELPDGVLLSVNHRGFRQRVLGGTIRPRVKKFLTIPVAPEAHGKRAGEFPDLVVVFGRNGRPVGLARKDATQGGVGRGAASGLRLLFRFARSVTQAPDPTLVPPVFELAAAAQSAVNAVLDRAAARARRT